MVARCRQACRIAKAAMPARLDGDISHGFTPCQRHSREERTMSIKVARLADTVKPQAAARR
jgi:hypothetical protein